MEKTKLHIREKTIVSSVTLFTTLLAYWYARENNKDAVPYLMIGGFLGSIIGETIAENINEEKKKNKG